MSAVSPGALVIFSAAYLPMPSCVIPRWTGTSSFFGSLVKRIVLFGSAEIDVHQARNGGLRIGVAVVVDALDERVGAVPDADDGDAHLVVLVARLSVGRGAAGGRGAVAVG